jgi:hypothetical protein
MRPPAGLLDLQVGQVKRMAVEEPPFSMPKTLQAERPSVAELVVPSERAVAELWMSKTVQAERLSVAELGLPSTEAVAI